MVFRRALSLIALAVLGLPAFAAGGGDIITSPGRCTGSANVRITVGSDRGRLEIGLRVDARKRNQLWRVVLRRDGNVFTRTRARTSGSGAVFKVRRRIRDRRGPDTVSGRATSASGQVCRASATIG